jgi:Ca-activated chloride channel family protein
MQQDNKFEYAQQAAVSLVRALRSNDMISITSFETKARVEVPLTAASDASFLENAIAAIPLGNETDLYEGLRLAWEQIMPGAGTSNVISRVILLTDGQPTRGKTNEKEFLKLADEIRQSGIPVTTIGVGSDYNERLLMAISQATGSAWYHVSNPSYVSDIFADEVTQMAQTVLQSPLLTIIGHEGSEIVDAYTMKPMVKRVTGGKSQRRIELRVGDIVIGQDQTVCVRVRVSGRPSGQYPLMRISLAGQTTELSVTSTDDESLASVEADPYPRLLWVASDGLTLAQQWLSGDMKALSEVETRIRTLTADPSMPTVVQSKQALESTATRLSQIYSEATRLVPGGLSEDDKKRLWQETTIIKKKRQ